MRNLPDVIDKMLEVIPLENNSLIGGLESIQSSALFAAPEIQSFWWQECASFLNRSISEMSEDLKIKLEHIFMGE